MTVPDFFQPFAVSYFPFYIRYLEETLPKNIATSIKDKRFLDFFFRMVRPIGLREKEIMEKYGVSQDEYPYCSPCGTELNFIRPAATPIVFHSFDSSNNTLLYAGTKTQKFQISDLAVSELTGRLYHKSDHMKKATALLQKGTPVVGNEALSDRHHYALIRSAVVVSLSDHICPLPDDFFAQHDDATVSTSKHSDLAFSLGGQEEGIHPIPWLPEQAESGDWAMPFSEDAGVE